MSDRKPSSASSPTRSATSTPTAPTALTTSNAQDAAATANSPSLLDPKNDYVFKRLFAETHELLVALINAVRSHDPPVAQVQILNPRIDPEELEGKFIVLDILAEDVEGVQFNIEMQVQGQRAWGARSVYYLASLLAQQLKAGKSYEALRPVVWIHLLDFDYFKGEGGQEQREGLIERRQGLTEQGNDPTGQRYRPIEQPQALWHFALRDRDQPQIMIDAHLQLHLLELAKAYRLGIAQAQRGIAQAQRGIAQGESSAGSASTLPPSPYSAALWAWILFFERWNEEEEMSAIVEPPVQQALTKLRAISADDEARRLATARERALSIERTELHLAHQEGRAEGEAIGQARGREEGRAAAIREVLDALAEGNITEVELRKKFGIDPS